MNTAPKVSSPRPEVLGGPVPYLLVEGALRDPFGVAWSMGAPAG